MSQDSEAVRSNPFDLHDKVALVTGGNRGIGLGMARALAAAGADLVLWGRDSARNAEAAETLRAFGGHVHTDAVDVADEAAVDAAMDAAVARMGRVDTVIANAGVSAAGEPFTDFTTADLRRVLGINLHGAAWTLRAACRHMKARAQDGDPGGSLIGVSSLGALHGMPRAEAYAMSKAGVEAMMRSLAVEFARYGIRANSVAPGWIQTEINPGLDGEVPTQRILPRIPMRRWGQPGDFGGIAVYLASDASAYHTGDKFLIDGGYGVF